MGGGTAEGVVTDSLQTPDRAVRIATDLVNTDAGDGDGLNDPAHLRRFLLDHAEPEPVTVTAEELEHVRRIRRRLRAVFETDDDREAAAVLNELLDAYATRPYLSDHDGTPWHVHVSDADADWARWLAATTAVGLAVLVAGHGFGAFRSCMAAGCERVFVSHTRQARRFCSPACATRTRVSAYRRRQREGHRLG